MPAGYPRDKESMLEKLLIRAKKKIIDKSVKNETTGCLEWQGKKNYKGYAQFRYVGTNSRAGHRIVWIINNGSIPDGLFVLHSCDVRHCLSLDHLFLGTNDDNMKDMVNKGRARGRGKDTPPWNKGIKFPTPWNIGRKRTQEAIEKQRISMTGKPSPTRHVSDEVAREAKRLLGLKVLNKKGIEKKAYTNKYIAEKLNISVYVVNHLVSGWAYKHI